MHIRQESVVPAGTGFWLVTYIVSHLVIQPATLAMLKSRTQVLAEQQSTFTAQTTCSIYVLESAANSTNYVTTRMKATNAICKQIQGSHFTPTNLTYDL